MSIRDKQGIELELIRSKIGADLPFIGKLIFVDPANGNDSNSGYSVPLAVKTLPIGYGKLTANKNDVLVLIGNESSINLSAQLVWAKDYTHFVGLCAPNGIANRARIFQTSTVTGMNLFKVTASGCIFKNLYFFHGVNDATSKICVEVTGQRNYFENIHFAGIGNATMSVAGSASLKINGGSENKFVKCNIGVDTATRDADATEIWFDSDASRNVFEDCFIYGYSGAAGYCLVTVEDATAIDRFTRFINCFFATDSVNKTITMGTCFNIKTAISQGWISLEGNTRLKTDGASASGEWDSNNRGIIFSSLIAPSASATGGVCTKQ